MEKIKHFKPNFGVLGNVANKKMKNRRNSKVTHQYDDLPDYRLFDEAMKEVRMMPGYQPEKQRIDMMLIHERDEISDEASRKIRKCFEDKLRWRYNYVIKKETVGDLDYKLLHCPFRSLCEIAQFVNLEMPLNEPPDDKDEEVRGCCSWLKDFITKHFFDDETEDDYTGLFDMDRVTMYKNYNNPTKFFRPATRSFLVHKMFINMDITKDLKDYNVFDSLDDDDYCCSFGRTKTLKELKDTENDDQDLQKINLPFLIMKNVYKDSVVLHEASEVGKNNDEDSADEDEDQKETERLADDPRALLNRSWTKLFKFQPLWRIRNYFGEKIALYFAWSGHLITSLWLPMLFGLAIFIYGLFKSINKRIQYDTSNPGGNTNMTGLLDTIKQSFDNDVTPYFAMVICIWGTIFLEFWKRKEKSWAFLWDVTDYEVNEPDRPEFYGTTTEKNPVDGFQILKYPIKYQVLKFLTSGITLLFMVLVVMASVMGVIIYRVLVTVDYCGSVSQEVCLLTTTVVSSLLNALSIFVLGKFYDFLAVKLTDWENHRTQTKYDDSLIMKLFAFQFVNNYSSCFYIAFFRGRFDENGIIGHGSEYRDQCEGTCMSQLSFQILTLMITKPLPKLCTDAIIPSFKKLWRRRPSWCCRCFGEEKPKRKREETFLEKHVKKENLGDFTLGEYMEKIIIFGFLMLFAASFPLAPLLALITTALDIRIDAWRLLWIYKRPVAHMAQDIGTWYTILSFMNFCGVVSNGFLVAFTSSWGNSFSTTGQLWIVIGFEHIALIIMFIFAYIVPDTPADVELKKRKKTHMQSRDKKYKMGEAIDRLQRSLEEENHRNGFYLEQDLGEVPRQEPHRRVIYRSPPSATTATDIILERPQEVMYYEYQDRGHDNTAYDQDYGQQEYIVTSPVKRLKKRKKKRTRKNSVEDMSGQQDPEGYTENIPVGTSARVVIRDRSDIDV
ncbi:anoctamin-7-like isoform X2 [Ostrea edulis]|uniref:anoctamin-7-like isoform X2 n=1 Tax=Ostrea edulis TaxID=37623 RepID=UPI0024AF5C8B|nr:anoctamin-7-like isoform X2 [Ostrea edulis]